MPKNSHLFALSWAMSLSMVSAASVSAKTTTKLPSNTIAASSQPLTIQGARQLLELGRAADLAARPALWDWTKPVTAPQVSQITSTLPARPAVAAAPAPEDNSDFLDEVSVTATRRPTKGRETTATTYTLKKEDFRSQGAVTATDALQLIPGFIGQPSLGGVRNAGGNFLRGFDDQRFQVLRDGFSQTFPQNGRSAISQLVLDDFDRIEVVTGGATLRYGSGSVGGVINLITETPSGPPKLTLEYQTGSYGYSKYLAKYGGGDDTFSYNFVYSGLVAFNNYPFKYTLPSTAQFYGPTSNPIARIPQNALDAGTIDPTVYPSIVTVNGETFQNSYNYAGSNTNDPANSGSLDLFGYLKPQVGPPVTVAGTADSSYAAQDSYTAKLTFKPDPNNKLTLRANQTNRNFDDQGPGANSFGACTTGSTSAADGNGTTNGDRFVALNPDGTEAVCRAGQSVVGTATTQYQFGLPFTFNTSKDGTKIFPTGQPYGVAEGALANIRLFQRRNTANTDLSLNWDNQITPTTAINSYAYYLRQVFTTYRPSPYFINTNLFRNDPTAAFDAIILNGPDQPFSDGRKFELQTALNTQLSPGQTLTFGFNFVEDRVQQQQGQGTTFFDRAIARTSVFLIDDISFGPEFKANLGLRYTSSSQFGEVLTPGVGIRYTPNNLLSFRANWSQVFNAPNIGDLYTISGPFVNNPNLRPETGNTYDVGVDISPSQNVALRLTYFNTYLNDTFTPITFVNPDVKNPASPNAGTGILQQTRNIAGRRASGIEAEVNWQISEQLRLRVAYTNTDARAFGLEDSIVNGAYLYQFQDVSIPFNNVAGTLSYTNKGFLMGLTGRYDSGKRRNGSDAFVPAWTTLDLSIEVPITPIVTLTGNVFNLTDTQYEFFDGNPAPGTTFRVGARLEFGG